MFDLVIKNGTVIDGTGSPGYNADVAVKDGKIVKIGRGLGGAVRTIDAAGLVVSPGFIDSHSHADTRVLRHPDLREKVEQGITVSANGMCGSSNVPLNNRVKRERLGNIEGLGNEYDLRSDPVKYFEALRQLTLGSGMVYLIGHGTLRASVMGIENRAPTAAELDKMKDTLRICMDNGARGLSFGLYYAPGNYASQDELVELAKIIPDYDGVVAAHIRNEGDTLEKSVREFLHILKVSGNRGIVSHHKAMFRENWGKVTHTLRMIDEANAGGMDVYCDVYPYTAASTTLSSRFLPTAEIARGEENILKSLADPAYRAEMRKWAEESCGTDKLDWVQLMRCRSNPEYSGRFISDIAKERGQDDMDTVYDIIQSCGTGCSASYFSMCEEDVETVIRYPRTMVCTDSSVLATENEFHHPRLRASFPRMLGHYVRDRKVVSLPEMIRKMTAMPARVFRIAGKGLVWEGMDADLCLFDPDTVRDACWFDNCWQKNEGLAYVLIGGEVVAENGTYNGNRMGKVIL